MTQIKICKIELKTFYSLNANPEELWQEALDIVSMVYVNKKVPKAEFNSIVIKCLENLNTSIDISRIPPTDLAVKEYAIYFQCQD